MIFPICWPACLVLGVVSPQNPLLQSFSFLEVCLQDLSVVYQSSESNSFLFSFNCKDPIWKWKHHFDRSCMLTNVRFELSHGAYAAPVIRPVGSQTGGKMKPREFSIHRSPTGRSSQRSKAVSASSDQVFSLNSRAKAWKNIEYWWNLMNIGGNSVIQQKYTKVKM